MVLADTSIWIDYFRHGNSTLQSLLELDEVVIHPWILGELRLGGLDGDEFAVLSRLRRSNLATENEVMLAIQNFQLSISGIGYVDAQLFTSTTLSPGTTLWSDDKALTIVARKFELEFKPNA